MWIMGVRAEPGHCEMIAFTSQITVILSDCLTPCTLYSETGFVSLKCRLWVLFVTGNLVFMLIHNVYES